MFSNFDGSVTSSTLVMDLGFNVDLSGEGISEAYEFLGARSYIGSSVSFLGVKDF